MNAEEGHIRKPLPSKEVIATLPADGGDEFNRLIFSHSPYLLQHARNPVDWYPWGDEAFQRAKRENKPIFLSIGYTTCHWCHVMEHESFEDEEVAAIINEHYIAVKVDREERPDIDEVYMTVTQALTGGGGWPMTVFLTPEKDPFYAGTYFPRESVAGRPGIKFLLGKIHEAWRDDRENVITTAGNISERLAEVLTFNPGGEIPPDLFEVAFDRFQERFDPDHGGFSRAPKFPVPTNLMFLMRYHHRSGDERALDMVETTLRAMRSGGVYDHIGFGIHRYSTDRVWLLPHFEKMLYDQAMAVMAYVEAYQITEDDFYARVAREILDYVLRDMTHPDGGFYSAEDADSEGEEGKFYVWTTDEVREVLGVEDAEFVFETFNFAGEGNFEDEKSRQKTGENIPHLRIELDDEQRIRWEPLRKKLFDHREKRVHPQKDDKILTDWNGLMISAFARAGMALDDEIYSEAARRAADFVLTCLRTEEGRLLKRWRRGEAGLTAHLEDYAFMIWGLLDTYECTLDTRFLESAIQLQEATDEFFWDEDETGYFMTADDSEELIVRAKKLYGGAIPGGNSSALLNLARLHRLTGKPEFAKRAEELVSAFASEVAKNPTVYPLILCGLDFRQGPSFEIVVSGKEGSADTREMLSAIRKPFLPNKVVVFRPDDDPDPIGRLAPYTREQVSQEGKATVYVCRDFTCRLPTTDVRKAMTDFGIDPE